MVHQELDSLVPVDRDYNRTCCYFWRSVYRVRRIHFNSNKMRIHMFGKLDSEQLELKEKKQAIRKSQVRICVTYMATAFLFGVSTGLIFWFICQGEEDADKALAVFNTTLPIAAGIITYWFATRSNRKGKDQT